MITIANLLSIIEQSTREEIQPRKLKKQESWKSRRKGGSRQELLALRIQYQPSLPNTNTAYFGSVCVPAHNPHHAYFLCTVEPQLSGQRGTNRCPCVKMPITLNTVLKKQTAEICPTVLDDECNGHL